MNLEILIISSVYDFSTDLVAQELENCGLSIFGLIGSISQSIV